MGFERYVMVDDRIEIDVFRLFRNCLKKVKLVLLIALVFSIIVPGCIYVKDKNIYKVVTKSLENICFLVEREKFTNKELYLGDNFSNRMRAYRKEAIDYDNVYQGILRIEWNSSVQNHVDVIEKLTNALAQWRELKRFSYEVQCLDRSYQNEHFTTKILDVSEQEITIEILAASEDGRDVCMSYIDDMFFRQENSEEVITTIPGGLLNSTTLVIELKEPYFDMRHAVSGFVFGLFVGAVFVVFSEILRINRDGV